MFDTEVLERTEEVVDRKPQYRTSEDGIVWGPWDDVIYRGSRMCGIWNFYIQARIWARDHWEYTPFLIWDY